MAAPQILAVMGLTGAGKSTFVKNVTGDSRVVIGHSMSSETQKINSYNVNIYGRDFTIVDTPGFEDEHRSDSEVLKMLVNWLTSSYRAGQKLSGILYLYRIDETRMKGSSLRNLSMFKQLCGEEFYNNLTFGTTCWSIVPYSTAVDRESQLKDNMSFWKSMISKGARLERVNDNATDARDLVYRIANRSPAVLKTQRDVVDLGIHFNNLQVTSVVNRELDEVRDAYRLQTSNLLASHAQRLASLETRQAQRREQVAYEARQERIRYYQTIAQNCRCKAPAKYKICRNSGCSQELRKWTVNYHCCSCWNSDCWHCGRCGNNCGNDEHPYMSRWEDPPDDCTIM